VHGQVSGGAGNLRTRSVQEGEVEVELSPGVKVRVVKQTLAAVEPKSKPAQPASKVIKK